MSAFNDVLGGTCNIEESLQPPVVTTYEATLQAVCIVVRSVQLLELSQMPIAKLSIAGRRITIEIRVIDQSSTISSA